jgi:hypothetical protein
MILVLIDIIRDHKPILNLVKISKRIVLEVIPIIDEVKLSLLLPIASKQVVRGA